MARLRRLILSVVAALFLLFFSSPSWSCSCATPAPSKCEGFHKDGPIFVGTVVDIENPPDETRGADQTGVSRYHFRVDENIFGISAKEVDVYSGSGGADCSYHFRTGDTYLVMAYAGRNEHLSTNVCSGTTAIAYAQPLLSELRARRDGKKHASLFGLLQRSQQPYTTTSYEGYDRPISGISVQLMGGEKPLAATTDENGVFRFYNVPAGKYHFLADLPSNLELAQTILSDPIPPLELPPDACYQHDLDAMPTSKIRGSVVDPDGNPVNVDVSLFRADRFSDKAVGWWEYQDEKGYFEFLHVTPGTYVLVAHNSDRPEPDEPFARTFYPKALDLNSAVPIVVGDGQQIQNADIQIVPIEPTRQLTIRVKWPKGSTPDNVFVTARAPGGETLFPKKISAAEYRVSIFRTGRYEFYAWQNCGRRREGNLSVSIGDRETPHVFVEGADSQINEVTLMLLDESCHREP